ASNLAWPDARAVRFVCLVTPLTGGPDVRGKVPVAGRRNRQAKRGAGTRALVRIQPLEKTFTSSAHNGRGAERRSVETYYQQSAVVLGVLVAGFSLVAVAFIAARIIAPRRPSLGKLSTYECGTDPVGEGWSQSQIRYYIYAFLFVIFDVESVFL